MRKVTKKSCYKKYHIEPDGSLKYLGTFEYTYTEEVAPKNRTRVRAATEAMLENWNTRKAQIEAEFESLVDSAANEEVA